MEMGEYEKAAEDFTLAISISRFWSGLYYLRGEAYVKMKQYEKVIENASSSGATKYPDESPFPVFLFQRAWAYKELGQKEKDEADMALIKKQQKKKRQKRGIYWLPVDPDGYEKALQEEACKRAAAIQEFTAAIEADKNNAEAYYNRGLAYMEEGKIQKAIRAFTNAVRIDSNFANAYLNRAECFDSKGQLTKALNDYAKVTSLDPGMTDVYEKRARIYELLGDTEKVIAEYEHSSDHGYYRFRTIEKLAGLYEETGRYEKAVEFYTFNLSEKKASSLSDWKSNSGPGRYAYYAKGINKLSADLANDPENAALYFIRGKAYDIYSRFENAVYDYTKAIQLQPDMLIAYYYRMLANSALVKDTSFDSFDRFFYENVAELSPENSAIVESMIADLTQVIRINDADARFHAELGILYNAAGKHKPAIDCFSRALAIDPNYHEDDVLDVLKERALAFEALEEYQSAIDDYSRLIEYESPWAADYLEKRGKCYQELHEDAKAKADFDKTAELREEG
jgi:tetratricopeptide (TPR) repeat protein